MGRTAKPTALHVVNGNPSKRARGAGEPQPVLVNDLTPPAHLTPASAAVWQELAPMLRRNQVLTEMDVLQLEILCDSIADYRAARAQRGDKFVESTRTGSMMLSQMLLAQQTFAKRAQACMASFGMSPADRTRVLVNPQLSLLDDAADAAGTSRFFKQ